MDFYDPDYFYVEQIGERDNAGRAKGTSYYLRDSDSNLLEFIIYSDTEAV